MLSIISLAGDAPLYPHGRLDLGRRDSAIDGGVCPCCRWLAPRGLALTAMLAAEGFAAISGSNSATVAAIGRVMVPEMRKDGYPLDFAAGTIACCGTVGIVTPPSIVFVLYGVTAGVSVGDLFLGGILTGW